MSLSIEHQRLSSTATPVFRTKTINPLANPILADQWYIRETNSLSLREEYAGKGVRVSQCEPRGSLSITKEARDYRHTELQGDIDPVWLGKPAPGKRAGEGSVEKFSTYAMLVAGGSHSLK